jgi:hypothetical protein
MPKNKPTLTDLGLTTPTQSSAIKAGRPTLQDLLSNADTLGGSFGEAAAIGEQIQQLQETEDPNILQQLTSPGGLATILAAGLAATQGGGEAALAVGAGGLGALQKKVATGREVRATAIENLQDQRDKALERQDKTFQRFNTLMTSNPDLFVDPETGEPVAPPKVLGFLATGSSAISINPHTRRLANERQERWEKMFNLYESRLEETSSLEDARVLTKAIFNISDWPDPPDAVVDGIARSVGTDDLDAAVIRTVLDFSGSSGLDALQQKFENGWSFSDSRFWKMLKWMPQGDGKITTNDVFINLVDEMNRVSKDPANREAIGKIKEESVGDPALEMHLMAKLAFPNRKGDQDLYLDEANAGDPQTLKVLQNQYNRVRDIFDLVMLQTDVKAMSEFEGKSPEQRAKLFYEMALQDTKAFKDGARINDGLQDTILGNQVAGRFQSELGLSRSTSMKVTNRIIADANVVATQPDGTFDRPKFEAEVERLTNLAIQQRKASQQ